MKSFTLFAILLLAVSCQKVNKQEEAQAIQAIMESVHQAHYSGDAQEFYAPNAEEWTDVRKGLVTQVTKGEALPGTQEYLDHMTFHEIITRSDPIIDISNDASLATYIGSVTVKGVLDDNPVFWPVAWQSILHKNSGGWQIIRTTNTEAGPLESAQILVEMIEDRIGASEELRNISSLADCTGPQRSFRTLVLSDDNNGRMEQIYGPSHYVLKHGNQISWSYDVVSGVIDDTMDLSTEMFVTGHELHWLALRPLSRLHSPIYKDLTTFRDEDAFHLVFKDEMNRDVNFFYSFSSYLPLGFTMPTDNPSLPVTIHFDKWEEVDGIQVFKKANFFQGDEEFEYLFSEVQINQIENADFEKQSGLIPDVF